MMSEISPPRYPHSNYLNEQEEQEQEAGLFDQIQQMVFHLKQEQLSPTLLPFKQELFDNLKKNISEQQDKIKVYKEVDPETPNAEKNYKTIIYEMQIQKVSFILKQYLRIRLNKIQRCSFYYFKNMSSAEKLMSKPQIQFLKKYVDLRYKYYEKNIFKGMIKNFRGVGGMELFLGKTEEPRIVNTNQSMSNVIQPDMDSYVFVKMNRNSQQFRYKSDMQINDVPQEESQIASSNDILFVPYMCAKNLMDRSNPGDLLLI